MVESTIAPGFLVAAPQLKDPNFERAVILMLEHDDEEGALGLIINRKAQVDLATVVSEMKLSVPEMLEIDKHPPLLVGGPVSPERGWILHTPDWDGPETRSVSDDLCVTSSVDILDAIVSHNGPSKYRLYLGYSGWGPHQLVGEIKTGAWITVPFESDLVFDIPLDEIWQCTLSRLGIEPSQLIATVGDA
ncbi:MAG: YqgE/AlgH family protein [Deltaproteobacteria bacterium]|nr:YqgE/AlgH family protein [Deltaproteobacteria bacterium]